MTSPCSFRPVSLLPVTSKLVEWAVMTQIMEFMETSGQLNPASNSYRKHHGTTTTFLEIADIIFKAADQNRIAAITTVDKTSAFDCVRADILLEKMRVYNFGEKTVEWFKNFLEYRSEYVTVGGKNSRMKPVIT